MIEAWLRSCGAGISSLTNPKTDVVLVGSHYLGQARRKIKLAQQYGIPELSESAFRRKFKI